MTDLDHADRIMAAKPGQWLLVAEPFEATNLAQGGTLLIPAGARLRVSCAVSPSLFAVTEKAERVAFGLENCSHVEIAPKSPRALI